MLQLIVLALALGTTDADTSSNSLLVSWEEDTYQYITGSETQCTDPATQTISVDLSIDASTPAIVESNLFYVWWVDSSGTACTTPETDSDDADSVITGVALSDTTASSSPLTSDISPLSFPSDIDGSSFTLQDVLDRVTTDVCGDDAIDHTELKLCMAVDTIQEIALDGTVTIQINEATEPFASLTFVLDNVAPDQPTIDSVVARDGELELSTSVASGGDHIVEWKVYLQESSSETTTDTTDTTDTTERDDTTDTTDTTDTSDTTDATDSTDTETTTDASDCTSWGVDALTFDAAAENPSEASLEITVTNGVSYDLCVVAVDAAGNESIPSDVTTQTAQDECDFIECYPGDLNDGYCTAAPSSLWWLLSLGLFWRSRQRRVRA